LKNENEKKEALIGKKAKITKTKHYSNE